MRWVRQGSTGGTSHSLRSSHDTHEMSTAAAAAASVAAASDAAVAAAAAQEKRKPAQEAGPQSSPKKLRGPAAGGQAEAEGHA